LALLSFLGAGLAFLTGLGAGLRAGVLSFAFDLRGRAFFAALLAFFGAVFRGLPLALVLGALALEALGFLALAALDFLAALAFFFAGFFRGVILLSNRCGF